MDSIRFQHVVSVCLLSGRVSTGVLGVGFGCWLRRSSFCVLVFEHSSPQPAVVLVLTVSVVLVLTVSVGVCLSCALAARYLALIIILNITGRQNYEGPILRTLHTAYIP